MAKKNFRHCEKVIGGFSKEDEKKNGYESRADYHTLLKSVEGDEEATKFLKENRVLRLYGKK